MILDSFDLATLRVGLYACLGSACLLGLVALLGFAFMLTRRRGPRHSLKFAALLVVVPLACPAGFGAGFVTSLYRTVAFLDSAVTTTGTVVGLAEDSGAEGGLEGISVRHLDQARRIHCEHRAGRVWSLV